MVAGKEQTMVVKELFSLWMATMLVATAEITEVVSDSCSMLTSTGSYPNINCVVQVSSPQVSVC